MKLVLIVGNGGVGKMTVGQELAKITDLRLLYNHMTVDLVKDLLGHVDNDLVLDLRCVITGFFVKSELPGLILTSMWGFGTEWSWDFIADMCKPFFDANAEVYCLELIAPQEVRLERNKTENRLAHKPSKRDQERSAQIIVDMDKQDRFESLPGEIENGRIPFAGYLRIENTHVSAADAAQMAKEKFNL